MENKRILVENLQFCEYFNKWLAENLKQALCAEEVYLINGEFMIIEDYDVFFGDITDLNLDNAKGSVTFISTILASF